MLASSSLPSEQLTLPGEQGVDPQEQHILQRLIRISGPAGIAVYAFRFQ